MLGSIGQIVAVTLLVGGAGAYLILTLRRWLGKQRGAPGCCGRGGCRPATLNRVTFSVRGRELLPRRVD